MNIENQTSIDPKTQESDPIIVLKFKKWTIFYVILAIIWAMWFLSFGTIVPYLTTGDFTEIWPAHHGSLSSKTIFFAVSWFFWLYFPMLAPCFRAGDISLYETHMEIRPYLGFFSKRSVSYDVMHVKQRGNRGMVLTNGRAPEWRMNIYGYWKAIYWEGINVPMNSMGLSNPECLSRALEMVRDRAITISKF